VLIDEARRRNRRRIGALAVVALLNHWLGLATIIAVFLWAQAPPGEPGMPRDPISTFVTVGLVVGAIAVVLYSIARYLLATRTLLKGVGATTLQPGEIPRIDNLVAELSLALEMSPVSVALVSDPVPNALTVGTSPSRSVLLVTTGLVEDLSRDELEAVLAVQLGAIRRLDVALQTLVVICCWGPIATHWKIRREWADPRSWLGIVVTWPSHMAARVVRALAYRAADYGADDLAVAVTRHPEALRSALAQLHADPRRVAAANAWNASLWFEPVPSGAISRIDALNRFLMTPSLEDRIARLPAIV
jgi:heat shock protein HtpX